jgi:hypothetical protein
VVTNQRNEGGHCALKALLAGRRVSSGAGTLARSNAGVTVSQGNPAGRASGSPAADRLPQLPPAARGLRRGGPALLDHRRHLAGCCILSWPCWPALANRRSANASGLLAVLVTGGRSPVVLWRASVRRVRLRLRADLFLLFGGVRPVVELQRTRGGGGRRTDADQLAMPDRGAGRALGRRVRDGALGALASARSGWCNSNS